MLGSTVDLKKGRSPRWVNVVTWAHKSTERSLASGEEEGKRMQGLKHEKDPIHHRWLEDEGDHMRRKAGSP